MGHMTNHIPHARAIAGGLVAMTLSLLSPLHATTLLTGSNCSTAGVTTTGNAAGQVIIGCAGTGSLQVNASNSGNALTTLNTNFGGSISLVAGFAGTGSVLVNGNGTAGSATINSLRGIQLGGSSGTGNLTVQNGGLVQVTTNTYSITIGQSNSTGVATVTGPGSVLTVRDRIEVGSFSGSSGSLSVLNGGLVQAIGTSDNSLFAGGSGTGEVLVSGSGSSLVTSGVALGNGAGGNGGTVTVEDGGSITVGLLGSGAGNGLSVGADSPSTILVTGAGSSIQVDAITAGLFAGNEINIGGFGQGALVIEDSATVNAAGANVHVSGGVFGTSTASAGLLTVRDGGSLTAATVMVFTNGTVNGNGTIFGDVIASGGTIAPGNSPGMLTIDGNYYQEVGSQLLIEIAGNGAGQFDVLNVLGTASFDSGASISLVFTEGFAPTANEVFDFLLAGDFDTDMSLVDISIAGLESGFQYDVDFSDAGTFTLTALTDGISVVPVPAAVWLFGSALGMLGWMRRRAAV